MQVVIPPTPDDHTSARQHRRSRNRVVLALVLLATGALVLWGIRDPAARADAMALQEKPPTYERGGDSATDRPIPYRLIVGGFADQSQAARAARRLRVDGWRVEVLAPAQSPDSQFSVQVGPLSDREAAEDAARSVRAATGATVRIVPLR